MRIEYREGTSGHMTACPLPVLSGHLTRFRSGGACGRQFGSILPALRNECVSQPCQSEPHRHHDHGLVFRRHHCTEGNKYDVEASKAPAQRGRTRARKVAMPNSRGPRMYMGPETFQITGRIPRSISWGAPVNILRKPATNAGDALTSCGRINASTKEKPHTRDRKSV